MRINPLMVRKIDAASGLANSVRRECSNTSPKIPTGTVPMISSHAMRWCGVSTRRVRTEVRNPRMIAAQSRQKNSMRATAVATWRPTRKAR